MSKKRPKHRPYDGASAMDEINAKLKRRPDKHRYFRKAAEEHGYHWTKSDPAVAKFFSENTLEIHKYVAAKCENSPPAMVHLLTAVLASVVVTHCNPEKEQEAIDWACGMLRAELAIFSGIVKDATFN
jgi:hypothetical protein